MLTWTLIFLVVALIAGGLGFSGVAAGVARILFFIFLVLFAISLIAQYI